MRKTRRGYSKERGAGFDEVQSPAVTQIGEDIARTILAHTPIWVYALFFVLLVFGLIQTRTRTVGKIPALLLPVGMIALSLAGIKSSFGFTTIPLAVDQAGSKRLKNAEAFVGGGRANRPWLESLLTPP